QRGAALGGELDLPGRSLISFQTAQRMLVKGGSFVWIIQYVREQTGSIWQIALSDASTVHAWIRLTDEQATAKDSAGTALPVPRCAFCTAWTGWSVPGSPHVRFLHRVDRRVCPRETGPAFPYRSRSGCPDPRSPARGPAAGR